MIKKKDLVIGFISILLLGSCHNKVEVLAIKNETRCAIVGAYLLDDSISDEDLYNNKVYMGVNVKSGELQWISMPDFKFEDKSDTSKLDLFMFCEDSLVKYRRLGIKKGILYKSLIKKIIIPSNTITKQDTITVK